MSLAAQLDAALRLREDYEPHELVDPDTLDLTSEYRRLNHKLFDGKLGTYPLTWNRRKNQLAITVSHGVRGRPPYTIKRLEFSKMFELTYQQFIDRLAHEMIHVSIIESGKLDFGGDHGYTFQREMRRINALGGFNISVSEMLPPGVKLRGGPNKQLVAILFDRIGGKKTELTTTEKTWQKFRDDLAAYPPAWLENYEIHFVLTDHGDLQSQPIKLTAPRRNQRFVTNVLPLELWDDIYRNGRRLGGIIRGRVT